MKLIDVTNSYATLVSKQLENTDARFVSVYSLGKTIVIHSTADTHIDVVLVNKTRDIKDLELNAVLEELLHTTVDNPELEIIRTHGVIEVEIPVKPKKTKKIS